MGIEPDLGVLPDANGMYPNIGNFDMYLEDTATGQKVDISDGCKYIIQGRTEISLATMKSAPTYRLVIVAQKTTTASIYGRVSFIDPNSASYNLTQTCQILSGLR